MSQLLLGLFTWIFAVAGAQATDVPPWRNLADRVFQQTARNSDLPNALIPATMVQDASGFIWLGGNNGLVRWDGYQFRSLRTDPTVRDDVARAEISVLHRDTYGRLWAGTTTSGLAQYEDHQNRLLCVHLTNDQCGTQHVWSIDDDGAGGLWIATDAGLFRTGASGKAIGEWHHVDGRRGSLPADEIFAVLRDHNDVLWVGTSHGLVRRPGKDAGEFSAVTLQNGQVPAVSRLMEDSVGRIWVGTRQAGAYVIGPDRASANIIASTAPSASVDTAPEITALLEISPGRVWLGTYGDGIVEVDSATPMTRRIVHDALMPSSLDGNGIQSLYRDNSGIIWVGTEAGLSQYNPPDGLMTISGNEDRQNGLNSGSVMAVLAAPDGGLWTGSQGHGFSVLHSDGKRVTGLAGHSVFAFAPAPAGGVLMGTDGGLFLADPSGRQVVRLTIPQLSQTADIRVLQTIGDVVWLGARDQGLWELHVDAAGKTAVLRFETSPYLTSSAVEAIAPAPGGRLAVGTDNGFTLLGPEPLAVQRILPDRSNPLGLGAGPITSFTTDRRGRLWVGTSDGLDRLDGWTAGRPRFRHLGKADGLPNASIDSLLVDTQGLVWASTDLGLASIDPDTLKVHAFRRADGLAVTNYWDNSASITKEGEMAFGGVGGLTMVRPEAVHFWEYHPPVVVTAVHTGGQSVEGSPARDRNVLVLPEANSLVVEFAALDFSAPAQNRYSYRLDGFDTAWTKTDWAHRVASYTNLPPGDYTLRLRGSNREGSWTERDTTLSIKVLPFLYQTLWFQLVAAVALALFLLGLLRGATALLRQRQRDLECQVMERTAELSLSQTTLLQANADLETRVAERTRSLEASEARFRAWFDNAEDAVSVVQVKPDGGFVYEAVNPALERLSGISASAYIGRQPGEVFPADIAKEMLAHYDEAAAGEPIRFETHAAMRLGQRSLDTWIVPVRNPATGQIERLVSGSWDVTERRALEARLVQTQKLQALGVLAGGIAHDFNNILQAVAGAAVLIGQSTDNPERVRRFARGTVAAAERGASITKRLLAFARNDDLLVEATATAEVLRSSYEAMTYTLGTKVSVRTEFTSELPPVLADRGQLEIALVNLGTNARDAMNGEGVLTLSAKTVSIPADTQCLIDLAPGAYVRIDVSDTGRGMDTETMRRAVDPFFTTKLQGQGAGLGLGLVKGFAEQCGGGLHIGSTPGVGTTVSLWLRQANDDALHQPKSDGLPSRPNGGRRCILVVDDDDLVRETVEGILEEAGFDVITAACGADALTGIQAGDAPNVLLCDLSMPGIDGIETIRQIRGLLPGLPSVLLTGYADERTLSGKEVGFTLLHKPVSAKALIAQLSESLCRSEIHQS